MGGNALSVPTRRYEQREYLELYYHDIFPKLVYLIGEDSSIRLLPAYATKTSFGDMDILIKKGDYMISDLKGKFKEVFGYQEIYCNGNVWSFDYKDFQIDLVFTKPDCFETSLTYYSWNDLGNLMGRVANKLGTKYGHKGLEKKIYTEDRCKVLEEVLITKDPKRIFDFLGYDYERFRLGFNTLEDIFNFAVSSKYFTKELFYLENLDHENRTRNRKRKTYMSFLQWLNEKNLPENTTDFSSEANWNRLKESFPEIKWDEKLSELREKERRANIVKSKFNGNIVMELTGLKDKELGRFINNFKELMSKYYHVSFDRFILDSSKTEIEAEILSYSKALRRFSEECQNRKK